MEFKYSQIPKGERITVQGGSLVIPDNPIIPFIEGDGIGPDIWSAARAVMDSAVQKAFGGLSATVRQRSGLFP